MNLLQFKYFREVVVCGSVTQAARQLHVTQPAVSKQLCLLAKELNCDLWIKRKNKLRLTEAGRIIFQHAELILEQIRLTQKEVDALRSLNELTGTITVGCGPLLSRTLLPGLSVDFINSYPGVSLSVYETDSALLPSLLEDGSIDLGLGAGDLIENSKIKFSALLKDEYLIIHSSKLIIPGDVLPVSQLGNYPFIDNMSGSKMSLLLKKRLKLKELDHVLYARNSETVIEFVKRGAGIAFIPSYLFKALQPKGVIAKHIDKPVYQNIGIYYLPDKDKKQIYKIFEEKVRQAFKNL